MPLDVQPLSRSRQTIMLVFMLGLLLGSLGFAQLLINRRHTQDRPALVCTVPLTASAAPPVNDSLDEDQLDSIEVNVNGKTRKIAAVDVRISTQLGTNDPLELLVDVYTVWTGDESLLEALRNGEPINSFPTQLNGHSAIGLTRESTTGFAIVRLTVVKGQIVAICFSGAGPLTDADWRYFAGYCIHGITIEMPSTK